MSKKENNTPEKEKVVTRYDLKMQRRAEEKKQAEREELRSKILGILILVAVFCFVAYFPVKNYLSVHGAYIKVNGEKVTKVEFDYHYNTAKTNYLLNYGSYLSYFGIDLSGDLSKQYYSDTLTWQDYFEQVAVDEITDTKALYREAKAAGFEYDTAKEYQEYLDTLKESAKTAGSTEKQFVVDCYGRYATVSRLKPYIEEGIYTNAYYSKVSESKKASDEEILAYYNENTASYDVVDYKLTTIYANLPTEPTDLADEGATVEEGETYSPSEAEIEYAMKQAKFKGNDALNKMDTEGVEHIGDSKSDLATLLANWLFDEERKENDFALLENSTSHLYYAVKFEKRYRNDAASADVRIIFTEKENGQAILDEWAAGAATEDSFAQIADKYNELKGASVAEGGLVEGLLADETPASMTEWLYGEERQKGDTLFCAEEDEEDDNAYVVYYVGQGDPEWKINISSTLLSKTMSAYMEEITQGATLDAKGHLNYVKVAESEAAASTAE